MPDQFAHIRVVSQRYQVAGGCYRTRIKRCEVVGRDGQVLAELPVTRADTARSAQDLDRLSIELLQFEEVVED